MITIDHLVNPADRIPFREPVVENMASFGSILYTIWKKGGDFVYVSIGGIRGQAAKDRKLRSRIMQHWQGMRSGDQFCIYVQEYFVLPQMIGQPYEAQNGKIDRMVRKYIHEHLSYAYVIDQSDEGNKRVRDYERSIQQGAWQGMKPLLNPRELDQFIGTNCYHRVSRTAVLTDGARYLAERAHCYWLMDVIVSYLVELDIQDWFVLATLDVSDTKGVVSLEDGSGHVHAPQEIPFTDFPLPVARLFANWNGDDWVLMLPSEY